MKNLIIAIGLLTLFSSNALAVVVTKSDSCSTVTITGPDKDPGRSYYINVMGRVNTGGGYAATFFDNGEQVGPKYSHPADPYFNRNFGPFESGHKFTFNYDSIRIASCKKTVELNVKALDPKEMVAGVCKSIEALPDSAFKNNPKQHKKTFCSKVEEVIGLITTAEASSAADSAGYYQQAIDKLDNDIAAKMDSHAGGQPNNDWITNEPSQTPIYTRVKSVIDILNKRIQ